MLTQVIRSPHRTFIEWNCRWGTARRFWTLSASIGVETFNVGIAVRRPTPNDTRWRFGFGFLIGMVMLEGALPYEPELEEPWA
jgi:hypothetical protein